MNGWDHPHNTSLEGRDVSESSARSEGISRTRKRAFNVTLRNTKNRGNPLYGCFWESFMDFFFLGIAGDIVLIINGRKKKDSASSEKR
ncbi:hypothetical protein AAC387_Pa05g3211 [Persea americana]